MFMFWCMLVVNFIVVDIIQWVVVNCFKCCYVSCIGFSDVVFVYDGIIYYYQYVVIGRLFISCCYYCIIEVEWVICVY